MRTVSLQGVQMTPGQRRMLDQQIRIRALMNPVLSEQVASTLAAMEVRKEQGIKPEKLWFKDYEETGTISVAEWMGF